MFGLTPFRTTQQIGNPTAGRRLIAEAEVARDVDVPVDVKVFAFALLGRTCL
jgi:hypothetical protein